MRFIRKIERITAIILLLTVLPAITGSAGWIEDKDGKTIIHVKLFSLPDPSDTDTFNRSEVAGIRAFIKKFPAIFAERYAAEYKADPAKYGKHNWDNVEIALEKFSGIKVEGVEVDLLAIAGGMAPDVLYLNFRKSDTYIRNNFLYPLDKPEDHYMTSMPQEELDFRINSKLWPVIKRKGPGGHEHTWAMPYGGALGKVLMFRKDLFEENNIPYPTVNWTWDNMLSACKKLTNPAKGIYGIQLGRGKHESFYWITYLWSAGGEVMTYNRKADSWRCVYDSDAAAVALDFYTRLSAEKWIDKNGKIRRGYSSKDAGDTGTKWDRGEIGMKIAYIDEKVFATINPEITGMVPVPLGPTGIRGAELNSRMMGLFSGIKDPVIRDAAWEYIRFYDSKESARIKTAIMVEGGLGRFVNPRYLKMFGYPEIERLAPKGWAETFKIAIATGRPEPYGKNSNLAYNMMTEPIQKADQLMHDDKLPENRTKRLKVLKKLLEASCKRANEQMIGIITPKQRIIRRISAAIVLSGIFISFLLVFKKIIKAFSPPPSYHTGKVKKWDFKKYIWAYVILIPAVLSILMWRYIPLLRGSVMAFQDYHIIGKSTWVGLDNFGNLLFDSYWWAAVWNSLRYSFLIISMTFLPPIILAILLQEVPRGKVLFRVIYYLPAVSTGLVTILLWKQFYEPSERGTLNAVVLHIPAIGFILAGLILLALAWVFARRLIVHELIWPARIFKLAGVLIFISFASLAVPILFPHNENILSSLAHLPMRLIDVSPEPYRWLSDSKTAMLACVIPMIWTGMGPGCLIYLAALKGIPDDYYEAADIDGANFIDKILFVVFPMLKALITINFIGVFITSWYSATGSILAMTGGAANTEVVGLHIWYQAFTFLKFGPATAAAWMLGFMLIGFTVHQLKMLSRVEFRAQGAEK